MTLGWARYDSHCGLPSHGIPVDDLYEHQLNETCWCRPVDDEGVFVHNAFDQRELIETGRRRVQ